MTNDKNREVQTRRPLVVAYDFWETMVKSHPIEPPDRVAIALGLAEITHVGGARPLSGRYAHRGWKLR